MSEIAKSEIAKITIDGKTLELPFIVGSENEVANEIKTLRGSSQITTIDPGFKDTASCKSAITFLNGEQGILRYRGYSIEDLAEKASFLETSYLLIFGELPTQEQLDSFYNDIKANSKVADGLKQIASSFPQSAHPMDIIASLTSAAIAFSPESKDVSSEQKMYNAIVSLLGQFPSIVSMALRKTQDLEEVEFDESLSYIENISQILFKRDDVYTQNTIINAAMDKLLILHADHEQNCSTSSVRIVGSSHASLHASIAAGISALSGPLHGGANQAVLEMLEAIVADGGDTKKYMGKAKDKQDPFRLMGFGHRVYKNFDPRAKIIKGSADEVLADLKVKDPMLDVAKGLEQEALLDEYFVARKLYPNVDFYSGIIYRAMGIPTNMFTVLFALGRLPGWIAQWKEMLENKEPIGRPRQIYTGENNRTFKHIVER